MTKSALDHDCGHGCAKVILEPKLHAFDDCFGGKIRMGDLDGVVERRGYCLFMEWKKGGDPEPFAQVKTHQAITSNSEKHLSVFVVGDPESMNVESIRIMAGGEWRGDREPSSLQDLKRRFSGWFNWVESGGFSQRGAA